MVAFLLTHWGRVMHICVNKLTIIGSDNGLSPGRRQAITWTNVGILLIGPLGTNFNEILIEIHTFSFKKMHLKTSSEKWRPFCLDLNVFNSMLMLQLGVSNKGRRPLPLVQNSLVSGSFEWNLRSVITKLILVTDGFVFCVCFLLRNCPPDDYNWTSVLLQPMLTQVYFARRHH